MIHPTSRRSFVRTASAVAGAMGLSSLFSNVLPESFGAETRKSENDLILLKNNSTISIKSYLEESKPKPLPFDPRKLNGISEKLMTSHWENNYQGSVKTLNSTRKKLMEAVSNKDTPPFVYTGLKREHLMRTGAVVNHELYFGNLGGNGRPTDGIQKLLAKEFGSIEVWESDFRKTGLSLSGGSGWVILGWNPYLGLLENYWLWDHLHAPAATMPLLIMDMYEHAYQMDYGAQAAKYIDAFFQNILWDQVEKRWEKARIVKFS